MQFESDWLQVYLPDNQNYYHVYQVGDLHPDVLGLLDVQSKWVSLQDVCNKMGMVADLYSNKGILMPKFETYYMVTRSRNLLIATRKRDKLLPIDYNNEDVFFRVFTNAFFQSDRAINYDERIVTKGMTPIFPIDILAMQRDFRVYRDKAVGYAWAIINGLYYEEISPLTCKVGDLVEWVYDASVKRVVEFPIDGLQNFNSTRDNERKYLLHYPGTFDHIEPQECIDLFLVERPAGGKANGLYHHKNTAAAMRQLTHKDYSVSVQLINAFVDGHPTWTDPQKLNLLALVRECSFDRPLVYETNRIHELYKLDENDIVSAMVGDNSVVENWKADVLENAAYPLIMEQSKRSNITRDMVQQAYGYNALSKILGDSPLLVQIEEGVKMVDLPRGLYENATMYEYDADGLLLGWYYHDVGTHYPVVNPNCALVEAVSGRAAQQLDELYDEPTQILEVGLNYRMYVCDRTSGVVQNNWSDVTDSGQYAIVDNKLQWLVDLDSHSTLVRSDKRVLSYIFNASSSDGLIEFDITKVVFKNGVYGTKIQDVPMGEIDIIMNGRSLIEHTDYVIHGAKVIIFNKKYLIDPEHQTQQIVVRGTGFCQTNITREEAEDRGFIKWELLSRNSVFNLRDDRVMRIVVDGRVRHRDSLLFSEQDQAYMLPNALNGEPYSIRDMVVPMRSFISGETYSLRADAKVVDKAVSDYLTIKVPETVPDGPNVIQGLYPVFSPFLCKILYDLVNGVIDIQQLKVQYDNTFVQQVCQPYEYILAFDPTQTANAVNENFMIIHPHHHYNVMAVDIYHYQFLQRVIALYMAGKVQLNNFLRLAAIN